MATRRDLLLDICKCPNVKAARELDGHPCAKVVRSQSIRTLNEFQVPAPWVGQIHRAPILFVSSNPSISDNEHHPTWRKSADFKIDYFEKHFGGGKQPWTKSGTRTLGRDGRYYDTKFYADIKRQATTLFGRDPQPGVDYALTWAVHCKSSGESALGRAAERCAPMYLKRTIEQSRANLIIVVGRPAGVAVRGVYPVLTGDTDIEGPVMVGTRDRWFAYLAHPSARGKTERPRLFTHGQTVRLRSLLID